MTLAPPFDQLLGWLAGSVRLIALFVSAPVFGHRVVPMRVRVAFALAVAGALTPAQEFSSAAAGQIELAQFVLHEVVIGAALGFAVRLLFAGFDLLGGFVSIQGGLGAASAVDPGSGASSMALSAGFQSVMLLAFLAIDGHHALLRGIALSYTRFPLGGFGPDPGSFLEIAKMGGWIFEIGVRLAAPITVAMLVANLGVGILGRTIPQLNLIMLQLPANVAVTLALLLLGAGAFVRAASSQLEQGIGRALTAALGGG